MAVTDIPSDDVTVREIDEAFAVESVDDLDDPEVRRVLNRVLEEDRLAALEIALQELALWDLHVHQDEIRAMLQEAQEGSVVKYHRAIAKTYLKFRASGKHPEITTFKKYLDAFDSRGEVSKAKTILIGAYERQDGTVVPEHRRRLPEGANRKSLEELKEIASMVKAANEYTPGGSVQGRFVVGDGGDLSFAGGPPRSGRTEEQQRKLDRMNEVFSEAYKEAKKGAKAETKAERDAKAEKLMSITVDNQKVAAAGKQILNESTFGSRIVAAADFVSGNLMDASSTIKFAAKAIKQYGPMAGMRMAHAYMRYGGYDVPLREQGGQVVTEMGDVLPDPISSAQSREWVIDTLTSRLPKERTYEAGSTPPSEGFIIDGDGNIIAHAVGRGKDHFLPFNTRHLKLMGNTDRVEMVRSRMVGGPTQEDLHAAMMKGVDKLTVVSNGGVFTVDFTKRSHGIKLEHFQVLTRYQDILDEYAASSGGGKKKGVLDMQGYFRALQSISDEFPLHINFNASDNTSGIWSDKHDYVQPRSRLMDQLKQMFGVDPQNQSGRDPSGRSATFSQGGAPRGILQGRPWRQEFNRYTATIEGDPVTGNIRWLNQVIQDYRDRGYAESSIPKDLRQELQNWINARDERAGVSQTPQSQQAIALSQARLEMQEELGSALPGEVVTGKVPTSSFAPDTKQWLNELTSGNRYPNALRVLRQMNVNVGSARDRASAEDVLRQMESDIGDFNARGASWDTDDLIGPYETTLEDTFDWKG